MDADRFVIRIKTTSGSTSEVPVSGGTTIGALKTLAADATGIDKRRQRLIYRGRIPRDEETMAELGEQVILWAAAAFSWLWWTVHASCMHAPPTGALSMRRQTPTRQRNRNTPNAIMHARVQAS